MLIAYRLVLSILLALSTKASDGPNLAKFGFDKVLTKIRQTSAHVHLLEPASSVATAAAPDHT